MKSTIQDVSAGQRPSAAWSNQVKDAACHDHAGAAHSDAAHQIFATPGEEALELYELTGAPTLDDDRREYKATAKPVTLRHCTIDGSGHWTADSTPSASTELRFRTQLTYTAETIWFPTGSRDNTAAATEERDEPSTAPSATTGDRVWTTVVQGLRVVVTGGGGLRWYDGTLPGALAAGDASIAGCTLTAIDGGGSPSGTVTVYNSRNLSSTGGYVGASGVYFVACYNQRTAHYEFRDMPCPP